MLNKLNFAVFKAAATDESRHAIQAVSITEDATVATNGHWLARVTRPLRGNAVGLLPLSAAKELYGRLRPADVANWDRVEASYSHETQAVTIVQEAGLHCDRRKEDTWTGVAGQFPATDLLLADSRKRDTAAEVTVSAQYLKDIANLVLAGAAPGEKHRAEVRIRLTVPGKDGAQPVEFHATGGEDQAIFAFLAPMRADGPVMDAGAATAPVQAEAEPVPVSLRDLELREDSDD